MDLTIAYFLSIDQWPEPPFSGWKRQWLQCHKCGFLQYYDYLPYSLSNPVMWSACGHELECMHRLKKPPLQLNERKDDKDAMV